MGEIEHREHKILVVVPPVPAMASAIGVAISSGHVSPMLGGVATVIVSLALALAIVAAWGPVRPSPGGQRNRSRPTG